MSISLFAGSSLAAGTGFDLERHEPKLWVNLLHTYHPKLNKTQLLNIGVAAYSNASIFKDTVLNILKHPTVKYVFIEWTSVPRYELSLGLETYSTRQVFIPTLVPSSHELHNITYTSSYLKKINDRFTSLAHDHYEIVCLLEYINSINLLCDSRGCQVFHINGSCPWDNNYFKKLDNVLPSEYTKYTKKQIQIDARPDEEIFQIYNKMHDEYDNTGGIHESRWLNLYWTMLDHRVDLNKDGAHPGIESNQLYFQKFSQALDKHL